MKKGIALLLAGLLLSLTACGGQETRQITEDAVLPRPETALTEETVILPEEEPAEEAGWTLADSPVITPELEELTDRATAGFLGTDCIPAAYIGTQGESRYGLLCVMAPTAPNRPSTLSVVCIDVDEADTAAVTELMDADVEVKTTAEEETGGWVVPESPELTEAALWAFDAAVGGVTDVAYTPIALVSTQMVSGMNYCILCQYQVLEENGENGFTLVYVYADYEGESQITDTVDFQRNEG